MGAYLDAPIKDKNPEPGQNDMAVWGACAMQGWRCSMEDAHLCKEVKIPNTNEKGMIFAVFDGHGGKEVAEYVK
jgi:serine/threonine protein phosphatase PrpC